MKRPVALNMKRASASMIKRAPVKMWTSVIRKASMTVEAALIAPLLLFSVFGILYLSFHLHNGAVLYCSAAEQAISGHVQEDPSFFGMNSVKREGTESKNNRKISFSSGTWYFSGEKLFEIEEQAEYQIVHPVKIVRTVYAAKNLAD